MKQVVGKNSPVTVKVVASVTVYVLVPYVTTVAAGQYVVKEVTVSYSVVALPSG
jgi:hypothetical protein